MQIQDYLEERRVEVDRFLEGYFRESGPSSRLTEGIRYSLFAGGKRIRPILLLASYEGCGGVEAHYRRWAVPVAAAIEMIHTYSLIHDDLPAMDNDDLRRGKATNHKVYGEALAILAGDSLLTEAFALLGHVEDPPATLLQVIHEIAEAAGHHGMAGGQALDLAAEGNGLNAEDLERLHRLKTGCLISAATTSGALLAGASELQVRAMRQYGETVGLAFQIADDLLDVEGSKELLGKNVGGDAAKFKATYPGILGLATAKCLAREFSSRAIEALRGFDFRAEPLRELARFIVERKI